MLLPVMKLCFVIHGALEQGPSGPTSNVASTRYRALLPAGYLARQGHAVQVVSVPEGGWTAERIAALTADAVIFTKSFHASNEELARALKSRGTRIVGDFCDDNFDDPEHGPHVRRMLDACDQVVASTETIAARVKQVSGRDSVVVSDPVEGPRGAARFRPAFPSIRVLWFGANQSLNSLFQSGEEVLRLAARMPVSLAIACRPVPQVEEFAASVREVSKGRVRVSIVPWTREIVWHAFSETDVVWIPTLPDARHQAKSPNRLLEGLWAGRLVVAGALPTYEPFAPFTPVGRSLDAGVLEAMADPAAAEARIARGQDAIGRTHSVFRVGRQWESALGATPGPMRLNLGCGDKILPGYVNVDVAESRAGMAPDVVCDLRHLVPFGEGTADEILSVHVIEHFWRWEAEGILREWLRVLKPGGRMIIECPNLEHACRRFMESPESGAREDKSGQETMWVFYGDPAWKDPLMVHRWGYTPRTLAELLSRAGLKDVRQEPAQFKLREPRDMRVVGTK